jgi:hypothetical protein
MSSALGYIASLSSSGQFIFQGAGSSLSQVMDIYPLVQPAAPGDIFVGSPPSVVGIEMPTRPTRPNITIPTKPVITWPIVPTPPGIEIPTMGSVTLGAMLTFTEPNAPTIDIAGMSIEPPTPISISPISWTFDIDEIAISDDPMVVACKDRLRNNIIYGGTGLSADIEADIWAREKERSELQLQDSTDKIIVMWAKKGFTLPDGLLAHSLSEVQKEYMNRLIDRSREIAIKQAELEQANLFKSMDLSINLAFKLIDAWIRYEELVFRTQEATAKFANEYIDLQIKAHNDVVEVFKARVAAYEVQIRAELAKVEVYKSQIQAALATVQMNEQTVKLYSAQIEAEIIKYKGVLEGDKILMEIFSEQIRAVLAEAQIDETIVKAYGEEVRACISQAELYKAEVAGMAAEVEAEKSKVQANVAQVEAWAKGTEALIEAYKGKIEQYKAQIQFNVSSAEVYNKAEEANLRLQIEKARIATADAEVFERLIAARAQVTVEAARAQAAAATTLAAGAMAAMSAHANLSYSESKDLTE